MSDVYENTKTLGEALNVDSFELYLVNEIDKVDDKLNDNHRVETYVYLQTRKNILQEIKIRIRII